MRFLASCIYVEINTIIREVVYVGYSEVLQSVKRHVPTQRRNATTGCTDAQSHTRTNANKREHTHTHAHTKKHTHAHTYTRTRIHKETHTRIHTLTRARTPTRAHTHRRTDARTHAHNISRYCSLRTNVVMHPVRAAKVCLPSSNPHFIGPIYANSGERE